MLPPPVPAGGSLKLAARPLPVPSCDVSPSKRRRKSFGDTSRLLSERMTIDKLSGMEENEQASPSKSKSLIIKLRSFPIAAARSTQNGQGTAVARPLEASNRDGTTQDKAGELLKSGTISRGTKAFYTVTTPEADTQITTQLSSSLDLEFPPSSKQATRSLSRHTYPSAPSSRPAKGRQRGPGTWEYEQFSFAQELDREWETPELSKDCVATYAEDGPWLKNAGDSGFLRQVKSVKGGNFQETQVLLAVRFVIL
jgi:hypothetical protein